MNWTGWEGTSRLSRLSALRNNRSNPRDIQLHHKAASKQPS